jgi:hypothetical protein
MTMAPVIVSIDDLKRRGLSAPLHREGRGLWSHHIPDTDINETVYDPRLYKRTGPYGLKPLGACCDDCAKHARSRGLGQVDVTITPIRVGIALAMIGGAWWALRRNRRSRR